jgi:hypothetical protein
MSAKRRDPESDGTSKYIATDEIREFLDADGAEVNVDSVFQEELREKLWEVVESKARHDKARGSNR